MVRVTEDALGFWCECVATMTATPCTECLCMEQRQDHVLMSCVATMTATPCTKCLCMEQR